MKQDVKANVRGPAPARDTPPMGVSDVIRQQIEQHLHHQQLPCAVAFDIAQKLSVSPAEIGRAANIMNVKLSKCQLGLFGYTPERKIVTSQNLAREAFDQVLTASLENGKLTCIRAWTLAQQFHLTKLAVSSHCESRSVKIIQCQLGAF